MDVIKVGNTNYIKASVIARELGYTSDYVGQLCRNRKIDSKLVGRSWYVDEASIREHKQSRYRSTQAKSLDAIKVDIHTIKQELAAEKKAPQGGSFYSHSTLKPVTTYVSDETELLPQVSKIKKGNLSVELAEANKVAVEEESERYTFETPKVPTIKFTGAVSITEYDDALRDLKEGQTLLHPKEVKNLFGKKRLKNKDISDKRELSKKVSKQKKVPINVDLEEKSSVSITEIALEAKVSPLYTLSLIATVAFSFLFALGVVGLETRVTFTSQFVTTSYVFNINNLVASVYNSLSKS